MAISLSRIESYLDEMEVNYKVRDEKSIITSFGEQPNAVMVIILLTEEGELLEIRTVKHLDDLVAEASEEKRAKLLAWMLNANYSSKIGAWEYDPDDHDHHLSISVPIEDGDLTLKQFVRMLGVIAKSATLIPEMKAVLGVADAAVDEKERKRRELLAQLHALDNDSGI
ncbi:hypothetical protein CEW87_06120 [Parazoarcus communis]|jgi:hypothetical protein|uniref:YbjN domain-containing protein n=1 Tax=Parazoarcus communis TaxID=41977 RepID=A0A2U8H2N2_9RHOO|nr:YbjN domain-containing protein [Parazoarcus communis]AWI78975.1 hypothetical protein CEW87_06120 [Parazoarcus communis]